MSLGVSEEKGIVYRGSSHSHFVDDLVEDFDLIGEEVGEVFVGAGWDS